ncbi:MAG: SpoIIE family protein phosphatase [Pseudanabaena sp.]
MAFSAYVRSRDALQKSVIDRLQVATSLKEYQLNEWVVNQRKDVIFLTQIPNVRDDLSALLTNSTNTKSPEYIAAYTRLNKFLAQVIANKPNLSSIIANTNGGYVVFSSQVDDDLVGKFRPLGDPTTFFTQKNANTVVPNFYLSRATGKAQITFATPVFDREDTRMGAISVNLALQDIDNLIRERTGLGRTSETYLVGRAGNKSVFISREDAKSQAESKKEIVEVKSAGVDLALAKQDGYGLYTNYAGIPVVGVFRWSTSQNLAILAEINQDEAFEPANRLARDILLIGLSSAGILLLAVYLLARRITQPILAIADAANQVSRGNLSAQAPILTKDEIGILAIAFNQMTSELKSSGEQLADYSRTLEHKVEQRTYELKEAKEQAEEANKFISALLAKMSNELEKGQQMQLNFLPPEVLQVPNWEISAFFKPARQVAGDFYDTFPVLDKYVGLVIADVCDKGVGAALFMALFRSLIRIFASQTAMRNFYQTYSLDSSAKFDKLSDGNYISELTPANILEAVALTNNYVAEHHGDLGMFATLFFGVLDPQAGELYYINGGHESLFIINSEGKIKQTLNSTGPAVGMMPNMKFKVEQVHLESGDILLGYTDGVTEARALAGEFFTNQKLLDIVTKSGLSVSQLINEINQNLNNHIGEAEQFDDITLIGIQRIN